MKPLDDLEQTIRDTQYKTSPALDDRILSDATAAMAGAQDTGTGNTGGGWWRSFMKNNYAKLATAAAIVFVPACLWFALQGSARQAYALQQTIEANRLLRSIHLRVSASNGVVDEKWAELDQDGKLIRLRMNFSKTEDGPKDVVWQADKADVWFKAKNGYATVREPDILARIPEFYRMCDPTVITNELLQRQVSGKEKIEIQQPKQAGEPVVITATSPSGDRRQVFHVNSTSKLVERVDNYRRENGQYVPQTTWEYLEYNQPIGPEVFVLKPPTDVIKVDETTQVIGLAKGELTDADITTKVAKEFFEALIAKDYTKAGQLYSGVPAAQMEKIFGKMTVLRIVSIGQPRPQPIPGVGGMVVDCQVELEYRGAKAVQAFHPAVRPVYSQPDRWTIHGGI